MRTIKAIVFGGVLLAIAGAGALLLAIISACVYPPAIIPLDYGDDDPGRDVDD